MRIIFRKAMFRELGNKTAIKFFPGSYQPSMKTDKLMAVTRFIDLFGFPEDMARAEAESLITSAFISIINDIHDPGSKHISISVFRNTDIRLENPGIYMDSSGKRLKLLKRGRRASDLMDTCTSKMRDELPVYFSVQKIQLEPKAEEPAYTPHVRSPLQRLLLNDWLTPVRSTSTCSIMM